MNMQNIRIIAKEHGLKTSRINKTDLIRAIQRQEGNFDCFGSAVDQYCDQLQCSWRKDCMNSSSQPSN